MQSLSRSVIKRSSLLAVPSHFHTRPYATQPISPTSSKNRKISAKERSEFISSSFKSVFENFLGNEETFETIDTKPIFAQPRRFLQLSQFHRDQVIEELESRMKQPWGKLSNDVKRLSYFISFGNWGAREGFQDNTFANVKPEDLPFTTTATTTGTKTRVKRLEDVDLWQVTKTRRDDFHKMTRRLDPVSKTVVYLTILISLIALYRDQTIGEDGMIVGDVPESPYLLADLKRVEEFEANELKKKLELEQQLKDEERRLSKKWYFLWLK